MPAVKLQQVPGYWPVHAHSQFSTLDGLGDIEQMVAKAVTLGYPALALTDHGNMAGALRLYKECSKAGLAPFPGEEFYFVHDVLDDEVKKHRMHLGILALNFAGFKALVRLSSLSFEQFYMKPIIDWANLAELAETNGEDVAITTGCRSGPAVQALCTFEGRQPEPVDYHRERAKAVVGRIAKMFPHTFVELQDHGIPGDKLITSELSAVAASLGLPVVMGGDSHYVEHSHQNAHDLMKEICYFGDSDDYKFNGGPYGLDQGVPSQYADDVIEGHESLLDLNTLRLPAMDKYKFYVPEMGTSKALKLAVQNGLKRLDLDVYEPYVKRVKSELKTIETMGFAAYFILMERILSHAREQGIFFNVRGSANGSLVCFILGITNVDPIKWDLSFDRFLSVDRKKPPDIDVDVESDRRMDFIDWIRNSLFPTMLPIGTYARVGLSNKPDVDPEDDPHGSLVVQYMAAHRKKDPNFDGHVKQGDWERIEALASIPARKSAGVHAAGYVLPSQEMPINEYLATMRVGEKKTLATQAVMGDVEDAGYVKGDFLGLRSLKTLRLAVEALGKDPVIDGMGWIPDDDKEACKLLRTGRTGTGIFQFEGFATAKGGRELGVRNTYDAILTLALYRPAMMNSGMTKRYIDARKQKQMQTLHPEIDGIMKDTWGVPVFQEQVIAIMRRVGLKFDDLNDILKAVKASGGKIDEYATATFRRVHPIFIRSACTTLTDCDKSQAELIWDTVMEFQDYGFAKSHATSYGLLAYRMAWLKAHHPVEFMAALLAAWAGEKKEAMYVAEARLMNLSIGRPDINKSEVLWTVDSRGLLRRGFLSVKGLGLNAAVALVAERQENGPFTSVADIIARVPARQVTGGKGWAKNQELNGTLATLRDIGALKSIGCQ
jgi:DNA polymerase-3 subunit alpha